MSFVRHRYAGLFSANGSNVTMNADGNLESGPLTNSAFAAYTYDARNRLFTAGGVTNVYDGMNNRIGQTQGTNVTAFVVDSNKRVLMRVKNGMTTYYIYGAGLLYQITETPSGTNTLTYHYDYRGSTVALSDDNGRVTDRVEYSLYATMTYRAGTNDTPFLFNGRYGVQTDGNGLLYMRARYYSPYLCRFINPDPSGFKGGLNFYVYANGNPVSYLDPFGLNAQATGDTSTSWNNVSASMNYYENMSANGFSEGGWKGAGDVLLGQVGEDLIDLSGAGSIQSSAEASGSAAGSGNTEGEVEYGVLAAGGVVLNAIPGEGEVAGKVEGEVIDQLGRDGVDIAEGNADVITMNTAVDLAADHVGDGAIMEETGSGLNYQFRNTYINEDGDEVSLIGRFDINPEDSHVIDDGPHLNLETQINGDIISNDHIPIDEDTTLPGDYP